LLTAKEWEVYPADEKTRILQDTFVLPWKIGNGNKTVFVVPKKVGPRMFFVRCLYMALTFLEDSKEENEEFDKFWNNRQEMKEHHVVDQYTLGPRFLEATNIEFKKGMNSLRGFLVLTVRCHFHALLLRVLFPREQQICRSEQTHSRSRAFS
jgi:hypothetical protein